MENYTLMDNTFALVSTLNQAYKVCIENKLKDRGYDKLAVSHGTIIHKVMEVPGITMFELAKGIGKTPQTTTTLVKKLVALNYLMIYPDSKDRRMTRVELLDKGKAFSTVIVEVSKEVYAEQYKNIEVQEVERFREMVEKITANLI